MLLIVFGLRIQILVVNKTNFVVILCHKGYYRFFIIISDGQKVLIKPILL